MTEKEFIAKVNASIEAEQERQALKQAALNAETVTLTISKSVYDLIACGISSANNEGFFSDEELKELRLNFLELIPPHWEQ